MPHTDIAIIGGGAAGLAAAIFAAQAAGPSHRVVILDRAKSLGAKILVSGGGRCNVTHDIVRPEDFNGRRTIVRNILAAFDAAAAVKWFASLGVELKREPTGKLFPVTDSARTVLQSLLHRCDELKIEIHTASQITAISAARDSLPANDSSQQFNGGRNDVAQSRASYSVGPALADGVSADQRPASAKADPTGIAQGYSEHSPHARFTIETTSGTWTCSRIILATGGRSLPRSGSDGSGWQLAAALGHTVTPTFAALVPLVLAPPMFHASLAGISQDVELSVFDDGKRIDRRAGSLLWTHFGISGPVVMDASRHWVIARESGGNPEMRCNLLHPNSFDLTERWLIEQATSAPRTTIINAVAKRLPERVAGAILDFCKIDPATTCGQLARESRRALAHALTALPLGVQQHRGWNYAEVTAGGVPLDEIDFRTMESRKVPGLYLAGEMLDCDGRIGGFNFQWAWATGYLAGKAAGLFATAP